MDDKFEKELRREIEDFRSKKERSLPAEKEPGAYAFIAMPMDPEKLVLEDVLTAIKAAARACGIHAERTDDVDTNERRTDRILASIRLAEYVIVDLTFSRPNVFFEAGYTHGIGKTPIYIARYKTKIPFDLNDYPVIFFKNHMRLEADLKKRFEGLKRIK